MDVTFKDKVISIVFNDTKAGNSFGVKEAEQLERALDDFVDAQALICTNRGRLFCAGGNLKDYAKIMTRPSLGLKRNRYIGKVLRRLSRWPGFTIAAVNGDCYGGGMEVLSAFDYVLSAPHCFFGLWQRRIGLSLGWAGGERLLERTALRPMRTHLLLAQSNPASRALRLGWIDEISPSPHLLQRAEEIVKRHQSLSQFPVRGIKSWGQRSEQSIFSSLWGNPDHKKSLAKFRDTKNQ